MITWVSYSVLLMVKQPLRISIQFTEFVNETSKIVQSWIYWRRHCPYEESSETFGIDPKLSLIITLKKETW